MAGTDGLRGVWEQRAADWVRWARSAELDHAFWNLNLPAILELVPPPGRLTLDVACGEGRLSRELARRGHRVIGIDSSPSLIAAAREADAGSELVLADAEAIPLGDGTADLVVASMALMTVDDMPAVVHEVARVLGPGGCFCISLLHPIESWTDAGTGSYFDTTLYEKSVVREGARMTFCDVHRPLAAYFDALEAAGFVVERLREPVPSDDYVRRFPEVVRWRERPFLLHVRAVLRQNHAPSRFGAAA
ncbi:MAG: class I SAM-dependent methyltransferase [Solirubrobacteraceae bacterium]